MTAPLYLLAAGALAGVSVGDDVGLQGGEGHHAATVARLAVGAPVLLADDSGWLAECCVAGVGKGSLTATVQAVTYQESPRPRFTLVQALAKADRDLLAIEVATELGVDRVIPWQADRSVVRWRGERGVKAERKWRNTVAAATKQARRARVPDVSALADRSALIAHVEQADLALVLHENASRPLAEFTGAELPGEGEVLLVVGPEGGITDAELDALVTAGARPVRLGDTLLRTSTAGSSAIALLSALTRWRA